MDTEGKNDALVSVIIPTYNRADLVTEALDSVREQTYRPIELIVVDDGSTDDTAAVVTDWKKRHQGSSFSMGLLEQANKGAPAARNYGLEEATGKYLLFLDSDDQLTDSALDTLVRTLRAESIDVVYGNYWTVRQHGGKKQTRQLPASKNSVISVLQSCPITSTVLLHREAIGSTRWREDLPCAQEFGFFLNLALQGVSFHHVDETVARLLQHDDPDRINNRQNHAALSTAIGSCLLAMEMGFRRQGDKVNAVYDQALAHRAGLLASHGNQRLARQLMRRANRTRAAWSLLRDEQDVRPDILIPALFGTRLTGWAYRFRRRFGSIL